MTHATTLDQSASPISTTITTLLKEKNETMKSTLTEAVVNFPNGLVLIENELNQTNERHHELARSNGSSVVRKQIFRFFIA